MIVRQAFLLQTVISLQLLVMPPRFPEMNVLFISIHIRQGFVELAQFLCVGAIARSQARKRRDRETKKKKGKRGGQEEVVLEHQRERVEEKVVIGGGVGMV